MSGLMIYLPKGTDASPTSLARLGLAELLEPGIAPLGVSPGPKTPDSGRGTLVFFDNPQRPDLHAPRVIDLEKQDWTAAPPDGDLPAGRYWIGYERASPPGPEDLVRRVIFDGEAVILCDSRPWVVPIAPYLPRLLTRNSLTGVEETKPAPHHREFCCRADDLLRHFLSNEFRERVMSTGHLTIPRGLEFAAQSLSKNYRVNADVVDALGLVGEWEAFDVARIACGLPPLDVLWKKAAERLGTAPLSTT